MNTSQENIHSYFTKIRPLIQKILKASKKKFVYTPTIFGVKSKEFIESLEIAFHVRQLQMKEGEIAQLCIGNFYEWENLGTGHETGLDCRKLDNSMIVEVKNKYNTCNSGSNKSILDKLATYKKNNPHTRCIWGIINPMPTRKKLCEKIIHNGVEIEKIQGVELFNVIFTHNGINYSNEVIQYIQQIIQELNDEEH